MSSQPIEIREAGIHYATIIKRDFKHPGVTFFTPENYSQQLGAIQHDHERRIRPHFHNTVKREIFFTNEVLIIRAGTLRVDFYHRDASYFCSHTLEAGDIILLIDGGHGFHCNEGIDIVEIKQGPYSGDEDKTIIEHTLEPEEVIYWDDLS